MNMIESTESTALTQADRTRIADYVGASLSDNTRKNYASAWTGFDRWCADRDYSAMPASAQTVAAYLADRADSGASFATCDLAKAAINKAHELAGYDSPTKSALVKSALKGIRRSAKPQTQAKALTADAVAMVRGHLHHDAQTKTSAAMSLAMVSLTAAAGLRISEAAALCWSDVDLCADGSGRVTIRQSKTDQDGNGAVVAIPMAVMVDLANLRRLQGMPADSVKVFGRSARSIGRRIGQVCDRAGLGKGFSGHSGRVGMAVTMTRRQAPVQIVMQHGRWSNPSMVARYIRSESASAALQYLA